MKKFFFPKSSSAYEDEHYQKSQTLKDKKQYPQTQWKTVGSTTPKKKYLSPEKFIPVRERKVSERKTISRTRSLVLRRSQSFQVSSCGVENSEGFNDKDIAELRDWKVLSSSQSLCDCLDCEKNFKNSDSRVTTIQLPHSEALRDRSCSFPSNSTSPRSSLDSTSVPGKVLDLYVDGEHDQEIKHGKITKHYPKNSNETNLLKHENRHESPRKLAKDVVERLLRIEQFYDSKNHGEILYDKHLDGKSNNNPKANDIFDKYLDGQRTLMLPEDIEDPTDLQLSRKLEEVKERVKVLSGHISEGSNFRDYYNVDLVEKEKDLVLEIYEQLQNRIAERIAAREEASLLKGEMNSIRVKLERENKELKSQLQTELDRRSNEWEVKVREFELEEKRLRERISELAEHNVCLQREVSEFYNKEKEYTDEVLNMKAQIKDLTGKLDVSKDKLKLDEEFQSSMEKKYKEKEKEYMELTKVVAKVRGTCNEQERTIDGLRQSLSSENPTNKLQIEQLRLTGIEQDLRKKLETCSHEINSLRSENIYLLERLKSIGELGGSSVLKLEQELVSHVNSLKNSELSLVNECIRVCENLLGIVERKTNPEGFLESNSIVEYGVKIRGFKKGLEELTRSLGKTSSILKEKTELANIKAEFSEGINRKLIEDDLKCELEAERLLTRILKEKLYSKEKEVEQMEVELARTLRNQDVLKREIQDASDSISCVNHKMKTLELQMIKKDASINDLQSDIRSYDEELTKTRGTLSKVTQERDLMWQEVKQYSEKNMLLNHEVASLKKKIEALEEDTLLKDGQISILKDSLNNAKSFNILFESEHRLNGF